jgi:MFS family permease
LSGTSSPAQLRTAFALGVVNGILFNFAYAFVDPTTVLPVFVSELTGSTVAVGLISLIAVGGWMLPQLLAANVLQARSRDMPTYWAAAVVRVLCWPGVAVSAYLFAAHRPGAALLGFLLFYGFFTCAGGVGAVAFMGVVGKTIPPTRLGRFFGMRQIGGGALAVLAGLAVREMLTSSRGLPGNYLWLFAIASVLFAAAWVCFSFIHEPRQREPAARVPMAQFFAQAASIVKSDKDFRQLLVVRLLTGAALFVAPFYAVYCRSVLGAPRQMLGSYISAQMLGSIVSNAFWAPLSDRSGNRLLLRVAAVVTALTVALGAALSIGTRQGAGSAYLAVFFLMGVISAGGFIGGTNYLLEVAPEQQRPTYVGAMNTFAAVTGAFPLVAGKLIEVVGYAPVFSLAVLWALLAAVAVARLREVRVPVE